MNTNTIKSELHAIAERLPNEASYDDAMYELYVRKKIADGKKAADEGKVIPHSEVKRRY